MLGIYINAYTFDLISSIVTIETLETPDSPSSFETHKYFNVSSFSCHRYHEFSHNGYYHFGDYENVTITQLEERLFRVHMDTGDAIVDFDAEHYTITKNNDNPKEIA